MIIQPIIDSFEKRSGYFDRESTWSVDSDLNVLCAELLLQGLQAYNHDIKVLDYGAGLGTFSRVLAEHGITVDVADISEAMLNACDFARERFLMPKDVIDQTYDRIMLRQVLQYIEEPAWRNFLLNLFSRLASTGRLLFSQIVPWCNVDYSFWRGLSGSRREARLSWPTENDFLLLCEYLGATVVAVEVSYTRQSLKAWVREAPRELQQDIRRRLESASSTVKALRRITAKPDGDITLESRWIHILVEPPKS